MAELVIKISRQDEGSIIAPEIGNRETLRSYFSKGFTHFCRYLWYDNHCTTCSLRRTYVTKMSLLLDDKINMLQIGTKEIQYKFYFDRREAVKTLSEYRVLPEKL